MQWRDLTDNRGNSNCSEPKISGSKISNTDFEPESRFPFTFGCILVLHIVESNNFSAIFSYKKLRECWV